MYILGINSYHADSSACIIKDGIILAAVEEERFNRIKHWAGFPVESIKYCLSVADISIEQVNYIAINRDPKKNFFKKILYVLFKRPSLRLVFDRIKNRKQIQDISSELALAFDVDVNFIKAKLVNVEHHLAHLASSYYVSCFDKSALLSIDGLGDFSSVMFGLGEGEKIKTFKEVNFPHSLGLFYSAMTQYLGYTYYGEEYKVMGLASYGEPKYLEKMKQIVKLKDDGTFSLNLKYFNHHSKGMSMTFENGSPDIGIIYSPKWIDLFGEPRKKEEEIAQYHMDIASSAQKMYEIAFFHMLNHLYTIAKCDALCVAGGCGYNSVANGKIFENTPFKHLYIQSACGDSGGAIGSAYYVYFNQTKNKRNFIMKHSYWGPEYDENSIKDTIATNKDRIDKEKCTIETLKSDKEVCKIVAKHIKDGKVIGWYQGRSEWGPRALGNRSIIVDPRRKDMKALLNAKIKKRESYRPFAPSIKREAVKDFFETDYDVPFMLQVYKIKKEKREEISAVTHVDGTGRLQSVEKEVNLKYWTLIDEFEKLTNVPVILNTSFNENEPVVNTPKEALDCFLRTKMDVLVLGNTIIKR